MKLFVLTADRIFNELTLEDYKVLDSAEDVFSFINQHKYIVLILGSLDTPQGAIMCVSETEQAFIVRLLTEWVDFFGNTITIRKVT